MAQFWMSPDGWCYGGPLAINTNSSFLADFCIQVVLLIFFFRRFEFLAKKGITC